MHSFFFTNMEVLTYADPPKDIPARICHLFRAADFFQLDRVCDKLIRITLTSLYRSGRAKCGQW